MLAPAGTAVVELPMGCGLDSCPSDRLRSFSTPPRRLFAVRFRRTRTSATTSSWTHAASVIAGVERAGVVWKAAGQIRHVGTGTGQKKVGTYV